MVAHMIAAGEKTKGSFLVGLMGAGFRFNSMVEADIKRIGGTSSTDELVARHRKTISTSNGPPGPPMAMLGEVVLHGEDVRRPLGIKKDPSRQPFVAWPISTKAQTCCSERRNASRGCT